MREPRDATKTDLKTAKSASSAASFPLILDIDDFKGDFSFDALFGNLVNELLPSFKLEDLEAEGADAVQNKYSQVATSPLFPEVEKLLSLFKDSCKELLELRKQIDGRLHNLKKDVSVQDSKHRRTLAELEKGVDGLFESFARLDSRISSVGQTAAKIGDHLQSADAQRETASQTIELIKYLMEFNSSPGDLMELSPLFSDDSRVAEAASIAQKLRSFAEEDIGRHGITAPSAVGNATASRGLEVAVANLQEYCNELENRLLSRFDAASQKRELTTMAECAKILSQFNRGTSAMQHYVATRPMFIDVEVMNADTRLVLGDQAAQSSPNNVARGLSSLYKEITDTVRKEAATITAVFPSPNEVMSILVQLKNTVESIRVVLLDAEEKQEAQNHAVRNWVRRLKDVLHPADDLLDEFLIEDMRNKMDETHKNKVTKVLHSLSPNKISFRRKMAYEIEKIQKGFNDVVKDMSGLNLNSNVVVVQQTNCVRRETSSFVLESDIIGREDDKMKIISFLRQPHENQNVSLIAVVGFGGLGKTTLAQMIYCDMEVKNLFEKRMWVCVSENFEVKTIVKNMLESLTKNKIDDALSLDNLQTKLRDHLIGKRYLLVLDDIWNESYEKWAQLKTYLMCGAQGSKVVVTTRSAIVAQTMGVSVPYVLNGLIPEESWSLLKKIASWDDTIGVNRTIESIGRKIAEKCKGVPLAIRSLGGILQSKSEERELINVLQGNFWNLCEDKDSIMPVLKLSYHNLSPQQRQCFAYCSLYPKDWEFEKDELIRMWMAHGYLDCSVEEKSMEDVGNQFVNIFLMKSFFQDAKLNKDGDINGFRMHDLMHDLATHVAGNDCCYLDSKAKRCPGRPVHVSLEFEAFCLLESMDVSRLRTLIMLGTHYNTLDREELSVISNFKNLRVLKLSSSLSKLSCSIDKLKHLRYLNLLRCRGLESLPKFLGSLVCIQTIKVSSDEVVLSIKVVSKLINLRHLEINNWTFKEKTQDGFRKLSIQQYDGSMFSKWLSPLTNIIEISLDCCRGLQYLPPLERLPFLKSLELCYLDELEYIYYEEPILHESFFPSLESLKFMGCNILRGWRRMGDDFSDINSSRHLWLPQFPRLSILEIGGCWMLTSMPIFPEIKTRLSLTECNVQILEATLNIAMSQYSTGFPPLSMLKSMEIGEVSSDVKKLPKDWLQNLTSLENLDFYFVSSEQFQVIEMWFKDGLNCLPSLQTITFKSCSHLNTLPYWVCNLSSLQHIKMINCGNLALLPEGMSRLTNLRTLEIIGCPLLGEEFWTETSATTSIIRQEVFWYEKDNGEPKRQLFYESGYSVRERNKRWAKLQFRKI